MKTLLLTYILLGLIPVFAAEEAEVKETLYQNYRASLSGAKAAVLPVTPLEQKLYVDALSDLVDEGHSLALAYIAPGLFDLPERLRIEGMKGKISEALARELHWALAQEKVDERLLYLILQYRSLLPEALGKHEAVTALLPRLQQERNLDPRVVLDLFNHVPQDAGFVVYKFCRVNRHYPCLMVLRNHQGELKREVDGQLWSHKSLAASVIDKPSYQTGGHTPAGVWRINSVMPVADQQRVYGKNRRMKLEFIGKSPGERRILDLLPESSHDASWWHPVTVARDAGRDLFRIHGTGRITQEVKAPYYPFQRTHGCIAQRENTYSGVTYNDQRILLDTLMEAQGLAVNFENEAKLKGVLYLIELDDETAPVELADLNQRGIL